MKNTELGSHVVNAAIIVFSLVAMPVVANQGDPIERRSVPVNGNIRITDYGYRAWGPEPVHYRIDPHQFDPSTVSVAAENGETIPSQVENGVLTFVAAVGKGQTASYSVAGKARQVESALTISRSDKFIEVRNESIAVRLPAVGEHIYPGGMPAVKVPGPLLGWASGNTDFVGTSRFSTGRLVSSAVFQTLRNGPALFEYEARYQFLPEGEYVLSLRLAPGMPIATISEDFDFGNVTEGQDLLILDLHTGWKPQHVSTVEGDGQRPLSKIAFDDYVAIETAKALQDPPVGGAGQAPEPHRPQPDAVLQAKIVPGGRWGGYKGGVQVSEENSATKRSVAIIPLHVGAWRRTMALNVWHFPRTGISVGLPISVRRMRWSLDIADDYSPFSTHEHDPSLKESYGRRVWGLYSGDQAGLAQARFGYIGLDRYKDWVVDYPEEKTRYPGVFFSPSHINKLKTNIDRHPDAALLKRWFIFSAKPDDAVRQARSVIDRLERDGHDGFFVSGLSHYRQAESYAFVLMAEDALANPDLPDELRRNLRRNLALHANLMSEPDFNPRGSGVHLGNNNMTINRTLALTYFAGLLHDHPRYLYWMDRIRRFTAYKLASQTSPDGAWIAPANYQLYSPTRAINVTQNVLRNLGIHDFSEDGYLFATLRYLAYLTVPDVRYRNRRIIPGMGNSANRIESIWGIGMAAVVDRGPEKAAFLQSMYLAAKGQDGILTPESKPWRVVDDAEGYLPLYLPDLPAADLSLATAFFPAYGVIFRHHFGPQETTLMFRAGMNWSHWDTDALNTILYAKGAPLSPGTAYTYLNNAATQNNGIYHNRVKVGRRDLPEVFGRVDGAIADYGFGDNADYAMAERYYPSQLFGNDKRGMYWRRHILFLKSGRSNGVNYFVIRDTFPHGERHKKWWNWMNLGHADQVLVNGNAFSKGSAPFNRVVAEKEMPVKAGQILEMKTPFGAGSWFWFDRKCEFRLRMTMEYNRADGLEGTETKSIVEATAGPGEDFFYLLYPRAGDELEPRARKLGDGVMRLETSESTDTVFVGDEAFNYAGKDIVFTGRAGVVRVFKDRVTLAMTSGSGQVGYKGHILEGHGPFERTVGLDGLRKEILKIDGGYEKKTQRIDLGRGVVVQGEAPYTAEMVGNRIHIRTGGRQRVIFLSHPEFIVRPQLHVDGRQWMASWTDYPASGWGNYDETWKIGIPVPAGEHELTIRNMKFPPGWSRSFVPAIQGVSVSH